MTDPTQLPYAIHLCVTHAPAIALPALALAYADVIAACGGGEVVSFQATGVTGGTPSDPKDLVGTLEDFKQALPRAGDAPFAAAFSTSKKMHFMITCDYETGTTKIAWYDVKLQHDWSAPPTRTWLDVLVKVGRRSLELRGFEWATVTRRPRADFVPEPPLARTHHFVTVTDAEVAEAYEDPDVYWRAWDKIEKVGDLRVCTRSLDRLTEAQWLGDTFESTMAQIRNANPPAPGEEDVLNREGRGRTKYNRGPSWDPQFSAWWKFGDFIADEAAGFPALAPVGHDPETGILELTGYIARRPLAEGGPEPRRVLLRELFEVWGWVLRKKTLDGKPVSAVHVIWPERWMAMSERRPLIDMGARVFYLDGDRRVEVF